MKLEVFNQKANEIWKRAAGAASSDELKLEVEQYKRLLNIFHIGEYYYIIFNVPSLSFDHVSADILNVIGYQPTEFNMHKLLDISHADDRPYFLQFEQKAAEFIAALPVEKLMKYKVRYDYRVRKADGQWARILHQSTAIEHDESGGLIRTLSVHTDITHFKPEGRPVLSFIGMDGEPSFIDVNINLPVNAPNDTLTKREKEILALLIEGKASKEIAHELAISKQTVDTHRKNMMRKNNCNNTAELIGNAIKSGWL